MRRKFHQIYFIVLLASFCFSGAVSAVPLIPKLTFKGSIASSDTPNLFFFLNTPKLIGVSDIYVIRFNQESGVKVYALTKKAPFVAKFAMDTVLEQYKDQYWLANDARKKILAGHLVKYVNQAATRELAFLGIFQVYGQLTEGLKQDQADAHARHWLIKFGVEKLVDVACKTAKTGGTNNIAAFTTLDNNGDTVPPQYDDVDCSEK